MSTIINRLRDSIASVVTNHFPSLISHLADETALSGLKIKSWPNCIDIIDEASARMIRVNRANSVYVLDMINSFDYYFSSAAPISIQSKGKRYKAVDFSTPRFHQVDGFLDFPLMCPSLTEPYITAQQYLDFAELTEGMVAIDLGSYSGLTSIAFSKAVGATGKVIALEPDPVNYEAAQTNIAYHTRINNLDNIVLMHAAASSKKGVLSFSSEGAMGSADASLVGNYRGKLVEVESLGLADIVEVNQLERVDFVKMDIEGSEEQVLAASEDFFRRFKPRIIIEPHLVNKVLSDKTISAILQSYGYKCENISQHGVLSPLVTGYPA